MPREGQAAGIAASIRKRLKSSVRDFFLAFVNPFVKLFNLIG
jgi:hypothetical protein